MSEVKVKSFTCRNCGGTVEVRAWGQSMTAVCGFCQSVVDVSDPAFRILSTANQNAGQYVPVIPIGRRGKIDGHVWEVIGYMVRAMPEWEVQWEEYLLFNPVQGYRFLSQQDGHWTILAAVPDGPLEPSSLQANHRGTVYSAYSKGNATPVFVLGEFYWIVSLGDQAFVKEFIAPPLILSAEKDGESVFWTQGRYVTAAELREAFGRDLKFPRTQGVAAAQPNRWTGVFRPMLMIFFIAVLVSLVLDFMGNSGQKSQIVFSTPNTAVAMAPDSEFVSPAMLLEGEMNNVEIRLNASLNNTWVETEGFLLNVKTGEQFPFTVGTEYYEGYEEGEYWKEGGYSNSVLINGVPGGEYELNWTAADDPLVPNRPVINLQVVRSVPVHSNLFLLWFLLALPVGIIGFLSWRFEAAKAANSDFDSSEYEGRLSSSRVSLDADVS